MRVLVPEVVGAVGAGGAECAVDGVEGDGVDGMDGGFVGGGCGAVAFEGEVGTKPVGLVSVERMERRWEEKAA